MGNSIGWPSDLELSDFQRRKLLYDYYTFYDMNKDGFLEYNDFELARKKICKINGWEAGGEKDRQSEDLFRDIWSSLKRDADENDDDKITAGEWLAMWEEFHRACSTEEPSKLPVWLNKYLEYRFHAYDRTGDGEIDGEEFEYVLSNFGIPESNIKKAWKILSRNGKKKVDFDFFSQLAVEYYRSDDPTAPGNCLTGRLSFDDIDCCPGQVESREEEKRKTEKIEKSKTKEKDKNAKKK